MATNEEKIKAYINNNKEELNAVQNITGQEKAQFNGGAEYMGTSASEIRKKKNEIEGLPPGGNPTPKEESVAQAKAPISAITEYNDIDWRVNLTVPKELNSGNVLRPLFERTNGKMIFPFNPTVLLGHSANYESIQPTHTNYPFYAYQNSQVDQLTISGNFVSENSDDAKYWIAVVHFLRTMTKMFYGNGANVGKPPMVTRLNGYGPHVFNNIPVLITNWTTDLPQDVDYIQTNVDGEIDYVPVDSLITVTCVPNYARTSHARFDLTKYARGGFVGGEDGFV